MNFTLIVNLYYLNSWSWKILLGLEICPRTSLENSRFPVRVLHSMVITLKKNYKRLHPHSESSGSFKKNSHTWAPSQTDWISGSEHQEIHSFESFSRDSNGRWVEEPCSRPRGERGARELQWILYTCFYLLLCLLFTVKQIIPSLYCITPLLHPSFQVG